MRILCDLLRINGITNTRMWKVHLIKVCFKFNHLQTFYPLFSYIFNTSRKYKPTVLCFVDIQLIYTGYASVDIHSVDMISILICRYNMIYPSMISTQNLWSVDYGYGCEISYPRQPCMVKARFPFKRNRLRWQAANYGCHCFDRAFLLAGACVCCVNALAFLAVFVYATHATQAIAFEWKPGLTLDVSVGCLLDGRWYIGDVFEVCGLCICIDSNSELSPRALSWSRRY